MKVGSSLSRCARDIYEGKVDKKDVLVIIARTDVDPYNDVQWTSIWNGYGGGGSSSGGGGGGFDFGGFGGGDFGGGGAGGDF